MKQEGETASPPTEYAFWVEAESGVRVQYSLSTFHEIDFQVNEGYRRIPHGGVEIGGVLWGRRTQEGIVLEAFRQIECEHASGPSFSLSEKDLAGIPELLARARGEEDLRSLEPAGWFVAHTRSPLTLSDRELDFFNRFLPGPGKITMLVKPERYQPTRFGLLLRGENGSVARDAAPGAFILPLPGRAGKGIVASIPAPAAKTSSSIAAPVAAPVARQDVTPPVPTPAPPPPQPPPPVPEPQAPRVSNETVMAAAVPPVTVTPTATTAPPLKRNEQFRGMPPEAAVSVPPPVSAGGSSASTFRLFLLLLVAAGLGCAVGYVAYLQLPSPYIALQAQRRASGLLVQWPAWQTRGVEYAAVRIDDGPPQLLTDREKESGEMEVQPRTDNTKVEIIAQHWIRDSRGIVRYVSAAAPKAEAGSTAPPANPAAQTVKAATDKAAGTSAEPPQIQ